MTFVGGFACAVEGFGGRSGKWRVWDGLGGSCTFHSIIVRLQVQSKGLRNDQIVQLIVFAWTVLACDTFLVMLRCVWKIGWFL